MIPCKTEIALGMVSEIPNLGMDIGNWDQWRKYNFRHIVYLGLNKGKKGEGSRYMGEEWAWENREEGVKKAGQP